MRSRNEGRSRLSLLYVRKGTGKYQENYLSSSIKNRHVELLAQQILRMKKGQRNQMTRCRWSPTCKAESGWGLSVAGEIVEMFRAP
jgi:hypothetical protein